MRQRSALGISKVGLRSGLSHKKLDTFRIKLGHRRPNTDGTRRRYGNVSLS